MVIIRIVLLAVITMGASALHSMEEFSHTTIIAQQI
jgi:hypothetical protein